MHVNILYPIVLYHIAALQSGEMLLLLLAVCAKCICQCLSYLWGQFQGVSPPTVAGVGCGTPKLKISINFATQTPAQAYCLLDFYYILFSRECCALLTTKIWRICSVDSEFVGVLPQVAVSNFQHPPRGKTTSDANMF